MNYSDYCNQEHSLKQYSGVASIGFPLNLIVFLGYFQQEQIHFGQSLNLEHPHLKYAHDCNVQEFSIIHTNPIPKEDVRFSSVNQGLSHPPTLLAQMFYGMGCYESTLIEVPGNYNQTQRSTVYDDWCRRTVRRTETAACARDLAT